MTSRFVDAVVSSSGVRSLRWRAPLLLWTLTNET